MKQNALGNTGYIDSPKQVFGLCDQAPDAHLGKSTIYLANPSGMPPKPYLTAYQSAMGRPPFDKKSPQRTAGYASGHFSTGTPCRVTQPFEPAPEQNLRCTGHYIQSTSPMWAQAKPTVIVKSKHVPSTATLASVGPSTASKEIAESTLTIIANFNQATN